MRKFFAILTLVFAACLFTRSATITGPIYLAYSNRPYSGKILIRPLSTPLPYSPNLVTGGDFTVSTDTNGLFSVDLQPGNYRVQVGADRAFTIDVPTNAATYTLLERITNALSWNSSIIPATNSYQLALTTRSGVVKTTSDQADPVAWLTNDTATIGRWLGSVTAGTIDELIATTAPVFDIPNVVVNGWSTDSDGRGGDWYYDYGATTTTNTGMIVEWGSGRLFRKWNGEPIDIQWFGAVPTKVVGGTNYPAGYFDNAPKINAAINWARTPTYGPTDVRAAVAIPAGDWWISTPITNRYRVDVLGLGCVFTDNEITGHAVSGSGLVAGASRLRLADGANCPMMVWDLSDASKRYEFAYTDDGLTQTATITIASPGVITSTAHGLTVGRRVGFTTTGALPTGITASTIYYVESVPTADTLTIAATSGGAVINTSGSQSGVHTLIKDPTQKYVAGNTIRGINFFGNSANQTRSDCHIIKLEYAWNVRIDNCNLGNPSGYALWAYECNTLDIVDCYGNGGRTANKGVFLFSCADGFMSQSKFGGAAGPALWIAGANGWQQQYIGNFLYNNFKGQFQVSSVSSDELTIGTHDFETGMPVELSATSGATLPTLTRYPSVTLDSHVFWAIKTASNKIKLAYSYEDALGGTALAVTGGSGTYYAWHGAAAGAYLSGGANNNVLSGNRCDQNQNFGIALNKATENVITGNLLNLNGYDSLTGLSESTTSAGVYLRNGSANNIVLGNSMMDWNVYAQTYGVWVDSNNGKNYIGQNAFKANPSQVSTLISSTGNTTETPVIQQTTGATIYADATGSPLTIARSDVAGEWKFELSGNTNIMRIKNSYVGNTALNISSSTTDTSINIGSSGSPIAPRNSLIYGEQPSTSSGTDVSAGDFYVVAGAGTGASTNGGKIRFFTPNATSSGTSVQSQTEKFSIMREGGVIVKTMTSAPGAGIDNGAIYPNSTDSFFYGRLGSAWHTLSTPNKTGVSTISVDASATFTFSPLVSRWMQVLSAPITANRTVTLSTSFAQQGTEATFIRTTAATGAFNWDIGGLINLTPGSWCTVIYDGSAWVLGTFTTSGGTLTDGDKGDITVSSSGATFTIDSGVVTYAKMQNVSAASKLLGRGDSGSGSPQEITIGSGLTMTGTTLSSSGGGGTGANPTASAGLTAVNGVATTFLRSDGAPAIDQGISPTWTGAHAFSKNGALSLPTFSITGAPITGGTATTTKPLALIETAGATSTGWSTSGTMLGINAPSGFAGRMLDIHLNGVSYMSLSSGATLSIAGSLSSAGNVVGGAAQNVSWFGRSEMLSPSDGVILLQNAANSDFTRLQLGGTTTSFPAIERSGTGVAIKLADGSADAPLTASAVNKVAITAPATGSTLTIADGKTFTSSNTLTLSGTDGSTLNVGTGGTLGTAAYTATGAYQAADSELAAIAGLTSAADRLPYFTGSGTAALATFTSAGRALVDDADASAQRTTLGLGTVATESTVPVAKGGTGATTLTAYAPVFGGTTGTGAVQSGTVGTAGQVLTSNGAGALPTFQDAAAGGSVATDTIWNAAGDLAVGTGSNTASVLSAGDYGGVLTSSGASATPFYATPNNSFTVFEQFLSHIASTTIFSEVFSGVSSTAGTSHDKDHPGVYSISTGSSATSTGYLRVGNSSGMIMVGGGLMVWEQAIKIPTLSDGTQTFSAHFGFAEPGYIANTGGNNHIKFIHDNSTGNWIISTKNNGTATTTTSGTAVPTGWQKIRIVVNDGATSVSFFVNGTEVAGSPITTNIPDNTDSMSFGWGMTKSAGTTARTIDTDYVYLHQKLTNPL